MNRDPNVEVPELVLKPGDQVDLTLDRATVVSVTADEVVVQRVDAHGVSTPVRLPHGCGFQARQFAPAEFPPEPGDVWLDRFGAVNFGVRRSGAIQLVPQLSDPDSGWDDDEFQPEQVVRFRGPLTLVFRAGKPVPVADGAA